MIGDPHDEENFLDFILSQAQGLGEKCPIVITENDLIEYLQMVNSKSVELTADAETLMKDYFVASRYCRQGKLAASNAWI